MHYLVIALLFFINLPMQAASSEALQSVADLAVKKYHLPGIVLGELSEGTLTTVASGLRANGYPDKVEPNDQFHIGSCFKAITSTLAAIYVEEGLINWDTTIGDVFSAEIPDINSALKDVTVEDLLAHRSGFNDADFLNNLSNKFISSLNGTPREEREAVLQLALKQTKVFPKGDFNYSNIGYTIVGAMLEKLLDKDFETLVQENIFTPLAMDSAIWGAPESADPNLISVPKKHTSKGKPLDADKPLKLNLLFKILSPAGGYTSMNMSDWNKFIQANFNGLNAKGERFLSEETVNKLHSSVGSAINSLIDTGYGYGWLISTRAKPEVFAHTGSDGYWTSQVITKPSANHSLLIMTNQASKSVDKALGFIVKKLWIY